MSGDFFREVDEDYRRDRLVQFWNRYQSWLIALAVLIVAATAVGTYSASSHRKGGGRWRAI